MRMRHFCGFSGSPTFKCIFTENIYAYYRAYSSSFPIIIGLFIYTDCTLIANFQPSFPRSLHPVGRSHDIETRGDHEKNNDKLHALKPVEFAVV